MTAKFGATSTTDDVLAGLDLKGKRVLVTGTSSGLGIETARALVAHGAYATKRRILEIVCLNCRLDGASAVFTTRKPFDVVVEGLSLSKSRGDKI